MKVSIACGGTGGHTFPGLAVGRELERRGHDVEILSAGRAIEGATMKGWEGAVFPTGAPKDPKRHPIAEVASIARCMAHFRRRMPAVLLAMGSYASVPPVLAARFLRIPVVLHEANAVPGRAVSFLARWARAIGIFFPECARGLTRGVETVRTGLPVRREIIDAAHGNVSQAPGGSLNPVSGIGGQSNVNRISDGAGGRPLTIFVTGGSQGAYAMNKLVAAALAALAADPAMPKFRAIHQTGNHGDAESDTRARYAAAGIEAEVVPFLRDMAGAFMAADIVVARAGAATCAEIAIFGKPAVFIPLPKSARDHQYLNARHFENAGAARVVRQEEGAGAIAQAIGAILCNASVRRAMGDAFLREAVADADSRVADLVETVSAP